MHRWQRPPEPEELRAQRAALTQAFVQKMRKTGKTPPCEWPRVHDATLQRFLSKSTARHCSYCDSLMGYSSRDTIDHLLPKSKFPCLAYVWKNLYLCCDGCQRKGTRFDKAVLRPDEHGYEFSRYFRYHRNGRLEVIASDPEDRSRAELTMEVLDLNDDELVAARASAFLSNLKPRHLPLRPGLDARLAKLKEKQFEPDFEDKPYRDFYRQD